MNPSSLYLSVLLFLSYPFLQILPHSLPLLHLSTWWCHHSAIVPPLPPPNSFFSLSFPLPLSLATTHRGPREGKWKVYVFSSGAVWQQEGKLLFYGFIYGSVDFWRCAHHTRGGGGNWAEEEWGAAWCELLLVPPVELQTSKEAEEKWTHAQTHSCILDQICMSYDLTRGQTHSHTHLQAHAQQTKYSWQDINFHKHVDPINVSTPLLHQEKHMNNDISPSNIEMYNLLSCLFAFFLSLEWLIPHSEWRRVFLSEGQLKPEQCLSPHTLRQTQRCHHKHLMEVAIVAQQMVLTGLVHALARVIANK